jgi:hypothetical protein
VPAQSVPGDPDAGPQPRPVRTVDGLKVVADEPLRSNLPVRAGQQPAVLKTLRLLTLEDGSRTIGCVDCEFTGSRGQVRKHRMDDHGAARGGSRRQQESLVDSSIAAMTIGEVVDLARETTRWADLFATSEALVEEWKERAVQAEAWRRKVTNKLAQLGFVLKLDDEDED